jgi:zinc protease
MKLFLKVLSVVIAGFLLSCSSTTKKEGILKSREILPFVGGQKVYRYEYQNGLKLLVIEDQSSPTFAIQTWFRVGSRDEVVGYTGLAHLFEHMMFKETKSMKVGEFDRTLEANGAEDLNAFTSRDYTVYVQQLPKDKLDLILKMESDRMVNLVVNDEQFKTEREVVQNERRYRNENSPDGSMYSQIYQSAFTTSNYRWPVIGFEEDLNRMSAADAYKFYQANYAPNHATIVIVGDVNEGDVASLVEKYYGSIPANPTPAIKRPTEPPQKSPVEKRLKLNTQVQKMMIGFKVPPVSSPDGAVISLLRSVLTNGKSSRLNKALVDSGIASSVEAYDLDDEDASLLIFHINLQKGRNVEEAEKVLQKEFDSIRNSLVMDSELEKAKNLLSYEFYEGISDSTEKAHFLGLYESITPKFTDGLAIYNRIGNIGSTEVRSVAQKIFKPENRTTIIGDRK